MDITENFKKKLWFFYAVKKIKTSEKRLCFAYSLSLYHTFVRKVSVYSHPPSTIQEQAILEK